MRCSAISATTAGVFVVGATVAEYTASVWMGARTDTLDEHLAGEFVFAAVRIAITAIVIFVVVTAWLHRERRVREEIATTRDGLAMEQRRAAAAVLASSIAHDLRNFLTVVRGNVELVLTDPALDPRHRSRLTVAGEGADRAAKLCSRLDRFGRLVRGENRGTIDIAGLLEDCAALACAHARMGNVARISVHVDGRPWLVGERSTLSSAVLNLVLNAGDAAGDGAIVELRARPVNGESLRIEVHDNGPGIPAEERERVFEPFYTTKPWGTGLGLPGVRTTTAAMGGAVEITDSPLGGTCVALTLPQQTPEEERPESSADFVASGAPPTGSNRSA